nr:MAG TPA: hypothetical protein [Caudoviricetes sp.]
MCPFLVALPPFSACYAYRAVGVMLALRVALGLQCGNVWRATEVTNTHGE